MLNRESLIQYRRLIDLRFKLDATEAETIGKVVSIFDQSIEDIQNRLKRTRGKDTIKDKKKLLGEFRKADEALKKLLKPEIVSGTKKIAETAFKDLANILSWDKKDKDFNIPFSRLSSLIDSIDSVPIGGAHLEEWVSNIFDNTQELQKRILASNIAGDSYREMYRKLASVYPNVARNDLISLARSYNQSLVVSSQEALFEENKDIVKRVRWSAIMEIGFKGSGRGTCARCAALDGNEYDHDESKPFMPLHSRCRCMWLPVTVTWNELFKKHNVVDKDGNPISVDEMEEEYKPFLIRKETNINLGRGAGNIISAEWTDKNYADYATEKGGEVLRSVVGPIRAELISQGKLKFKNIVDEKGRLIPLKELGFDKTKYKRKKKGNPPTDSGIIPVPIKTKLKGKSKEFGGNAAVEESKQFTTALPLEFQAKYHNYFLETDSDYRIAHTTGIQNYQPFGRTISMNFKGAGTIRESATFMHEFGHRIDNKYGNTFATKEKFGEFEGGFFKNVSETPKYSKALEKDNDRLLTTLLTDFRDLGGKGYAGKYEVSKKLKEYAETNKKKIKSLTDGTFEGGIDYLKAQTISRKHQYLTYMIDDLIEASKKVKSITKLEIIEAEFEMRQALFLASETGAESFILENFLKAARSLLSGKDSHRGILYAADTIGATTKNVVGFGHEDSYFANSYHQKAETFANIFLLSGNANFKMFLDSYVPNQTKVFEKFLKFIEGK